MIKTIIFDIDNTMYSFKTGNQAGMAALCAYAKEQFGIAEGEFLDKFKKGKKLAEDRVGTDTAAIHNRLIRMQVILELMGKPLFPHALNLYHCYWDALLASAKPEPGLLDAMKALKAAGLTLGVGTDMTAYIQYKKLERLGAAPYIDFITTSEEVGAEKPNPRLFLECARKAGVPAGECLFIGDSLAKDVRGAIGAGMLAFLYAPGIAREGTGGETVPAAGALAPAPAVAAGALAPALAVVAGAVAPAPAVAAGALAPVLAVAAGALAPAPAVPAGVTALTSFYDLPKLVREMNAPNR